MKTTAVKKHLIIVPLLAFCLLAVEKVPVCAGVVPEAHRETECAGCHSGGVSPQRAVAAVTQRCTDCHDNSSLNKVADFHGNSGGRCLECHTFHEPSLSTVMAGLEKQIGTESMESGHCQSCHNPRGNLANLSPAHRTAADLYHADASKLKGISPSQACLNCHSNRSSSDWQEKTAGAEIVFNEHASHPYGIRVVPGSGNSSNWIALDIDKRLPLFDERLECQTCHLLTAGNDDLMIPFETKYDLCKGCHRQYGDKKVGNSIAMLNR